MTDATPERSPDALCPDPHFSDHLEWQLRSALRREERFARPVQGGGGRLLRSAVLALGCLALGAGGVLAADRLADLRERELLLERTEVMLELARARAERVAARRERLELLYQSGRIGFDELAHLRVATEEQRYDLRRLELDAAEVSASGREPDDGLGAPLVEGRDFVLERLGLELERSRLATELHAGQQERAEMRYREGIASTDGIDQARRARTRAELGQRLVERRVALRREFLAGRVLRGQVELLGMRAAAELALERSAAELEILERELERWRAMVEAGLVSTNDASPEEEREALLAERALAELELRLIDARLGR